MFFANEDSNCMKEFASKIVYVFENTSDNFSSDDINTNLINNK